MRCQCQPGYVQCAQKCCLRYRKVNNNNKNNDYLTLLHGDNNKTPKFGENNNPNEINSGPGQFMLINSAATNPHLPPPIFSVTEKKVDSSMSSNSLFPAPISKRKVSEKKSFEKQ